MRVISPDSIFHRSVVNGVKDDFNLLLQRFLDTQSVRYEKFAEVWRNMKMPLIFAGRQNEKEVREFTEECITLAVQYVLPPNEFQTQVGGLFLLFGLYFKQLCNPRVKIRFTLDHWQVFMKFISDVRAQNHFDIEYIYWKLKYDNAFHYTASLTVQTGLSKDHSGTVQEGKSMEVEPDSVQNQSEISEIVKGDAIDQLSGIHEQYHHMKCALAGPSSQTPQASLNMIHPTIVQFITKKVASFEWWKKYKAGKRVARRRQDSGPTTSESEAESETERGPSSPKKRSKNMGMIRAEIKARAMGTSAAKQRSRRHRQVRYASDIGESAGSSSSPRKPTRRVKQAGSSEEEGGGAGQSSSLNDSQLSDVNDGLCSMPLFRHLEESKSQKRIRRKIEKAQKSGEPKSGTRKKKIKTESDFFSSSMDEDTAQKKKRKPRTKKRAEPASGSNVEELADQSAKPSKRTGKVQRKRKTFSKQKSADNDAEDVNQDVSVETSEERTRQPSQSVERSEETSVSEPNTNPNEVLIVKNEPSSNVKPSGKKRGRKPKYADEPTGVTDAIRDSAPSDEQPMSPGDLEVSAVSDRATPVTGDLSSVLPQTEPSEDNPENVPGKSSPPEVLPVKRGRGRPPKARRGQPLSK